MEQSLTLFSWFSGILILATVIIDVLLVFKFRRYFRANGFGVVTLTLVSFIAASGIGAFVFGITSLVVLVTGGKAIHLINTLKEIGSIWIMSSSLLHIMGITFQRVFSFSYGNAFLEFTRSKINIGMLIMILWMCSTIITVICASAQKPNTYSVFYIGLFISGVLTVVNFVITVETSIFKEKSPALEIGIASPTTSVRMKEQGKLHVVQNPRKTFSLFSGLVLSFILFCLPASIPNLIYNLKGELLSQSTSLIISMWLLLGVVFHSMWILMRLRSTINDNTGFYARWTLGKSRENMIMLLKRNKKTGKNRLLTNELDASVEQA